MSEQLYPLESFTTRERLEVARFGIFDDPPAVDVAALVAELEVAMLGTTDGDLIDPNSEIPAGEMFRLASEWVRARAAALEVSSRTVAPSREALARVLRAHGYIERWAGNESTCTCRQWTESVQRKPYTTYSQHMADALLAADLWQPAPVIDRDALIGVISNAMIRAKTDTPEGVADALLPFIGQPASPRTVTTVEELDALPVGSVIRNKSRVLERLDDRWYGTASNYATTRPLLPASVLYVPSEGVES